MEPDHHRDGQEDDFWYHIDFVGVDGIGVDERVGIEWGRIEFGIANGTEFRHGASLQ